MFFRTIVSAVLILACAIASSANAQGLTIALKGGIPIMDLDLSFSNVNSKVDEDNAFGLTIGYEMSRNSTVELELARASAELTVSNSIRSASVDFDVSTVGLYYTQRTVGDLYFAAKFGILREEVSSPDGGTPFDDTGFSWGVGGGYRMSEDFSIEAEYVKVEADIAWVLLSARYRFSL